MLLLFLHITPANEALSAHLPYPHVFLACIRQTFPVHILLNVWQSAYNPFKLINIETSKVAFKAKLEIMSGKHL